jgi:hypothetical protein
MAGLQQPNKRFEPMRRLGLCVLVAALPGYVLAGAESWGFVQSVGGIAVGMPSHRVEGWVLPVRADVSGLEAITANPNTLNSALICEETRAAVEGLNIYVTITSALARPNNSPRCPPVALGEMSRGQYSVFYRGPGEPPVRIGEVSLGL